MPVTEKHFENKKHRSWTSSARSVITTGNMPFDCLMVLPLTHVPQSFAVGECIAIAKPSCKSHKPSGKPPATFVANVLKRPFPYGYRPPGPVSISPRLKSKHFWRLVPGNLTNGLKSIRNNSNVAFTRPP